MLVDFRVKNYKSIKDEIVLSLVASSDKTNLDTHTLKTGLKSIPNVNRCAAVYGANASGKSNLLDAMSYMKNVVEKSASIQIDQQFSVQNFRLEKESSEAPTEFEITFLIDKVRYQYGFSMTQDRIVEEWLLVYKSAKPQLWFSRSWNEESSADEYQIGNYLKGPKEVWKQSTKQNSLFLSTAIQLNSDQLKDVYSWITGNLVFFGTKSEVSPEFTISLLKDNETRAEIIRFLESADLSISDIKVEGRKTLVQTININPNLSKTDIEAEEKIVDKAKFLHRSEKGQAEFELHEESFGTQRLFSLAGPILDILKEGKILIFDELDNSLHTLVARKLVETFQSDESNPYGAQLIFTSHDTELLNEGLLRRDQVWFVEKTEFHDSILYPLSDYSPRKTEALERGYLVGRYGAIPFLNKPSLWSN